MKLLAFQCLRELFYQNEVVDVEVYAEYEHEYRHYPLDVRGI